MPEEVSIPEPQPQVEVSKEVAHPKQDERAPGVVASDNTLHGLHGEVVEVREIKRLLQKQYTLMRSRIHVGPLPPAQEYEAYEAAFPGSAARILKMAESEQAHGQKMDREVLATDKEIASRGQHYAMLATALLGGLGAALGFVGHDVLGGTFVVSSLVPIVAHFLGGRDAGAKRKPRPDQNRTEHPARSSRLEKEEQKSLATDIGEDAMKPAG